MTNQHTDDRQAVKRQELTRRIAMLSTDRVPIKKRKKVSPMGERLLVALEAEGHKQTKAEELMIRKGIIKSTGHLSSLITGRRGASTINPQMVSAIADFLHVRFEWLVLGRGPMRRDGRDRPTNFEEAMVLTRQNGAISEEAIQSAWKRCEGRADAMSVTEWMYAFAAEDKLLSPTTATKK